MRTINKLVVILAVMIGVLVPLGAANKVSKPTEEAFGFYAAKGRVLVTLKVQPTQIYKGQELAFYRENGEKVCVWENASCPQQFLGAVRSVRFEFKPNGQDLPEGLSLREKVTLVSQTEGLIKQSDREVVIPVVQGVASDLQVWGHDEAALNGRVKKDSRKAFEGSWRIFRQELYVGDSTTPFAVITWKHTATEIVVVNAVQVEDPTLALSASK
jgi:hypothetical protein